LLQGYVGALLAESQRLVSLSPHATELVFAAGAADKLIAVVRGSDYPAAARKIPLIGDAMRLDKERLLLSEADLVIAWPGGNRPSDLEWLKTQKIPLLPSDPKNLDAIVDDIERIALATGNRSVAAPGLARLRARILALQQHLPDQESSSYYQIWGKPLIAVGGSGLINQSLHLCQFSNIFDDIKRPGLNTSREAVISRQPEVIFIATNESGFAEAKKQWQQFPLIPAVANHAIFRIDPDEMHRPTPRMIDATEKLCELRRHLNTTGTPYRYEVE